MKPNPSKTHGTGRLSVLSLRRIAPRLIAVVFVVSLALYSYGQVKAASYARLAPISVSLELTYLNKQTPENHIVLEYDYGYGFIPAHRQTKVIQSQPEKQLVEFTISSWKPARAARLSIKERSGLSIQSMISFSKFDKTISLNTDHVKPHILLDVGNLSLILLESSAANDISRVN